MFLEKIKERFLYQATCCFVCHRVWQSREGLLYHICPIGGFIDVADILALPDASKLKCTADDVRRIVANCPKQRFALDEGPPLRIRANQGHTLQVCEL